MERPFDTLAASKDLQNANFDEVQANGIVQVLVDVAEAFVTVKQLEDTYTKLEAELDKLKFRLVVYGGAISAAIATYGIVSRFSS